MHSETLHLDFETRSPLKFGKGREAVNVYVYAAHQCTGIWCAQIAIGDDDPILWVPHETELPPAIVNHMKAGAPLAAHNAQFERVIWDRICTPRYGWPVNKIEQWDCTMARAYAMALPGALDGAAAAIGLSVRKDNEGHRLMMQMAKPRSIHPVSGAIEWWDDPEKQTRLHTYCRQDVIVERELDKQLFRLSAFEKSVYRMDQRMNDRGVYIDVEARDAARKIVADLQDWANQEMHLLTGGVVGKCTEVAALTRWVNEQGVECDSLAADKLEDLLAGELPEHVAKALTLRRSAAKTSTAKLEAFERHCDADGRIRGTVQYGGAARTLRWAGRGPQLQNLKRPSPEMEPYEAMAAAIEIMRSGDASGFTLFYDEPLSVIADCLRGIIIAGPNNTLENADYSNIEGRLTAWSAREQWKLDAFRAYDEGTGHDLYLISAGKIFGRPPEEMKPRRQIGKVAELALGYEGGANAFATMAKTYKLKIADHFEEIWAITSERIRQEVIEGWASYGSRMGMNKRAWFAAEAIKRPWREAHPAIVQFWENVNAAAQAAVLSEGELFSCWPVKFKKAGSFLFCQLPSGHVICYAFPRLEWRETPWGTKSLQIRYMGVDGISKRWEEQFTYGGKLTENIVQAEARDILAEAMVRVENKYPPVMTIHDQIVSEVPWAHGSHEEFEELMSRLPEWATGLPLTVDGWRGERFRK